MTIGSSGMKTWYVLTTNNPRRAKTHLEQWNITVEEHHKDGQDTNEKSIDAFIPYTFIESGIYEPDVQQEKLSIRSALYRYLFVQGELDDISRLIAEVNSQSEDRLFFLQNDRESKATIRQDDMDELVALCSKGEYTLDLPLSASDLKVGNTIPLTNTPLEKGSATYKIVGVVPKKNRTYKVQIELNLFNVTFKRLFVTLHDVPDDTRLGELVGKAQRSLVDIFSRRVNDKQTEATRQEDEKTLKAVFENRKTPFPPGAMRRHFLALMLICAQLLGDRQEKAAQQRLVMEELDELSLLRESKAATDTRAYLHVAMYIATREPRYREMAKAYVKEHNPASPYLRRLVTTSSKREALKFMGDKSK